MSWQKDFFNYLHLYEGPLAQGLIWLIFLIFAVLIFFLAKAISFFFLEIINRFHINKIVAGSFILSIITSLPEITIAFITGSSNVPENSFNNLIGGTIFFIFIFSLFTLINFKNLNMKSFSKKLKEPLIYFCFISTIIIFIVFIPKNFDFKTSSSLLPFLGFEIPKINISLILLIFFISYLAINIFVVIRDSKVFRSANTQEFVIRNKEKYAPAQSKIRNELLIFYFSLCVLSLLFCVFCLTLVVDITPHVYHIPETSVSGLFLSFTTNMPELITTINMFKRKEYTISKSQVYGSLAINLPILFLADTTFNKGGLLSFLTMHTTFVTETYSSTEYLQVFCLLILLIIMFSIFQVATIIGNKTMNNKKKNQKPLIFLYSSEILFYIGGWALILGLIE